LGTSKWLAVKRLPTVYHDSVARMRLQSVAPPDLPDDQVPPPDRSEIGWEYDLAVIGIAPDLDDVLVTGEIENSPFERAIQKLKLQAHTVTIQIGAETMSMRRTTATLVVR